jgi:histidinol dehydrogenase
MKLVRMSGRGAKEGLRLLEKLEQRQASSASQVELSVRRIVAGVRKGGDPALRRYIEKFDGISPHAELRIDPAETEQAWKETAPVLQAAIKTAARNIRKFAERQLPQNWSFSPVEGLATGQQVRPLGSVGCYVPSGRHPLPSTLLMTVIPAQVAGVRRIVVVSPRPALETLAVAHYLGVEHFYRMGGAQAIAALAYGTKSISKVDKVVGPGNLYVTTAKRMIAFDCGIDMLAGPTEIVVTSDTGDPVAIAVDVVAQAEHDPEALAIVVTTKSALAALVIAEVKRRAKSNPIAKESTQKRGYVFLADTVEQARDITNRLAPEHLTVDSQTDLEWVTNAGSVFVGNLTPQPMGDYISGPNHTLPTGGLARVRGGLSVMDFVKIVTVQQYNQSGLNKLGPAAIALAEAEGLVGHAEAIRARGIDG